MNLSGLLDQLNALPAYAALLADAGSHPHSLLAAARPYLVAGLRQHRGQAVIVLTARGEMAQQYAGQLESWLPPADQGGPAVLLFAEPDALPFERIAWSNATRQQRLSTLAALQSRTEPPPIVVASARSLMQRTLPTRELRMALRPVRRGEVLRLEQMIKNWAMTGYNPAEVVEEPGTFARRGGIIDIWPTNLPTPVRIDLFGEEVESLRLFDPATQRTVQNVDNVQIGPGSEALTKYGPTVLERLNVRGGSLSAAANVQHPDLAPSPLLDPSLLLAIREELRLEVEHLNQGRSFHGIEWYLPYFYDQPATLLDYLPEGGAVVVDDARDLFATLEELEAQAHALRDELQRAGELPHDFAPSFFTTADLRTRIAASRPLLLGYGDIASALAGANTPLARSFAPGPRFGGKPKAIADDVAKLAAAGDAVVLVTRQAARIQSALQEAGVVAHVQSDLLTPPAPRGVYLVQGIAGEGFAMRGLTTPAAAHNPAPHSVHFFTDTELFGWSKPAARRGHHTHSTVAPEIFFADVKPGEHVVHLEHGVGVYDGLVRLTIGGMPREYLQVSYARGDKLYVPVHQAERLSRYVGAGEKAPPINRLGTADWQMVKERARRAVADIADDLLQLYAERELAQGHAFSPDGPWQDELAASFPYEETDDQLYAIDAVREDMEDARPMDRLICGDVGYGKTEVAVRAAFKAITDGKQVAMLVPTTVLAQQHYRTLSNRLSRFPVRVEMLSRFRTTAQQEKIVADVAAGSVDLVVGTHRLLSEDMHFKELGLLIIDEEQRFGVVQKERLKQLRTTVDVLTLSATPIPRTLHMSLSGVRDMSTINTPPRDRLPIHTVLAEYDDLLVRQAIERELNRNGQIFVVTDRVRGIQMIADRIRHLAPAATIAVGHGQMAERELEDVMLRFSEGDYDILVATTIIENGLDIPNANTIIIFHADRFGLAQLYQLRGRVGRSTQRGHCYLLYEKHNPLSLDARRRLEAIMESSEELGAGFRIAMRDLEIRGAGELLGARQHGQIDSVGFDLYTRLLAQAINEAKRNQARVAAAAGVTTETAIENGIETPARHTDVSTPPPLVDLEASFDPSDPLAPPVLLDLPIEAYIPATYVEEDALRLQMYRRIAGMTHLESIAEMRRELIDRFGADDETKSVPEEVENLFYLIRVKILALAAGVANIGRDLDQLVIRSEALENMDRPAMQNRLRQGFAGVEAELGADALPRVSRRAIYLPIDDQGKWRRALDRTLEIMAYA